MDDEKVSQVIRDCDAAHPDWKPEVRDHEVKETGEAEERAQRAREVKLHAEQ